MAGHSHWKQIKTHKGTADAKRGTLFSKLLKAVSIAARQEPSPDFNPRLRSTIEKARINQVPQENIERAISKASENKNLEDLIIEAYGLEGSAIIIEAITDNTNRTISEIKHLLSSQEAKMANQGSVLWSFNPPVGGDGEWKAKFPQQISEDGKKKLRNLINMLEERDDVQKITTNINL